MKTTKITKTTLLNWLRKVRNTINQEVGHKTSWSGRSNQTKDGSIHYGVDFRISPSVIKTVVEKLNNTHRKQFSYLSSTHQIKIQG